MIRFGSHGCDEPFLAQHIVFLQNRKTRQISSTSD